MLARTCLLALLIPACAAHQKPFDQMTAAEHRAAAARENELADEAFERIEPWNVTPPETLPSGDVYDWAWRETGGAIPYTYDPGPPYELGDPESYTQWPRVGDPSEKYEDAASKHREKALQHERAAALLEGKPSPTPLPPPAEPLLGG